MPPAFENPYAPDWLNDLFNLVLSGEWLQVVLKFAETFYTIPIFVSIIDLVLIAIIYMKSKSMEVTVGGASLIALLSSFVMPAPVRQIFQIIAVLGVAAVFWDLVRS